MAGTIPGFSLTPQFDQFGQIAPGAKLYTIVAGTTSTPQNSYQDSGLTILQPNPLIADDTGRLPQFFVADGSIKLRLTTALGSQIFVGDNLLVVGASSGGGGGSPVDPTTIMATGDVKYRYGTGVLTGFVRANGRTIGSSTSGATERANSDSQSLFEYLWGADANLVVSTGRGASANADWVANKTLALPDARGLALAGLDDMGNVARGIFAGATFFNGSSTVLGSGLGAARRTLQVINLPPYTPSGVITNGSISLVTKRALNVGGSTTGITVGDSDGNNVSATFSQGTTFFTGTAQGGTSTAFDTNSPYLLVTLYIKL